MTIGHFQALKHQLADMAVEIEPARSLYWYAAHAFDQVPEDAERTAALAKAHGDSGLSLDLRAAATVALLQSRKPTAAAMQTLFDTVNGTRATEDLGKMSLLVLGTLAGRLHGNHGSVGHGARRRY